MRYIQFAEHFAQQCREVVVVVDVRQEFAVGGRHFFPINPLHVGAEEMPGFLTAYVVEHIFTLFGKVEFHFCGE